jgi:hypothetical protein
MSVMKFQCFFILTLSFCFTVKAQTGSIFFPDDAQQKTAQIPAFTETPATEKQATITVKVDVNKVITPVSKYIYGTNGNIYMTQVVDQPDLVKSLQQLSPNIIRYPGGSISGLYFFNAQKNQPPPDAPAKILDGNTGADVTANYWYGHNPDSWTLSIDNYYAALQQTNSTGIITVNYDYARYSTAADPVASAAHLAAEWVRYDNGRTRFWEIGNESYGTWQYGFRINTSANHDGQPEIITGALYGQHFKVFADSMRKAAIEIGATIYIGAMLKEEAPASWWNNTDKNWNSGIFENAGSSPDYFIVHSYYTPYQANTSAGDILNSATAVTTNNYNYVLQAITAAGFGSKPIALTEWNIFAEGSKQQVSFINGMFSAMVLGEATKVKYAMAMRWDLANGWNGGNDHGMFNHGDEPGGIPIWNPRPSFYYMYYFQKYFGDKMVESTVTGSADVVAYASSFTSGEAGIVFVNKAKSEQTVALDLQNFGYGDRYYYYTLTGGTDNGEFSLKVNVNGTTPTYATGGPLIFESIKARATAIGHGVRLTMPARSVIYLLVEDGTNIITGTKEEVADFKVYPNPSANEIVVDIPAGNYNSVNILDQSGRILIDHAVDSEKIVRLSHRLGKGMYIVRLSGADGTLHAKVVVE